MPWLCQIAAWFFCGGAISLQKALLLRDSQPVLLSAPSYRPRKQELLMFPAMDNSMVANGSLSQLVCCPRGLCKWVLCLPVPPWA